VKGIPAGNAKIYHNEPAESYCKRLNARTTIFAGEKEFGFMAFWEW
jgi:hypothetical protein